jgi:hypothetical protein
MEISMAENHEFQSPQIPARPLSPAPPHVIHYHSPCPTRIQRSIKHGMAKMGGERSHDNGSLTNLDPSLDHIHVVAKQDVVYCL